MIVTTDRLRLRPMERKDIADFVRDLNDWEVQQWLSLPPFPYRDTDGEAYLAIVANNHATSHPTAFVVAAKESDAALGVMSVDIDDAGTGEPGKPSRRCCATRSGIPPFESWSRSPTPRTCAPSAFSWHRASWIGA